jgi:hypothetical protein
MPEPLSVQESATLCCGGAAPVPLRVSTAGEFEALLAKDALSEAEPLAWGVKVIVNEALCPAASVSGNEIPLNVNSEVPNVAEDIATLEPEALSEPDRLLLLPTMTLPKLKLAGDTAN